MPLDEHLDAERVEWRLGYLPQSELDRALSEATVAVFPVPRRARPVGRAPAGARSRRAVRRLRRRRSRRADSCVRCGRGRAGRRRRCVDRGRAASCSATPMRSRVRGRAPTRARRELTWDASAARAPRPVPRARVMFRRARYGAVIDAQLDLFLREHRDVLEDVDDAARAVQRCRARRGGGAVRRLRRRGRDRHRAPGGPARPLRADARRPRPATCASSTERSPSGCPSTRSRSRIGSDVERIEDYGIVGDLQTAALVGRIGSVDWLCFPRFDSSLVLRRAARHTRARPLADRARRGRAGDLALLPRGHARPRERVADLDRPRARDRLHAAAREGARHRSHRRGARGPRRDAHRARRSASTTAR